VLVAQTVLPALLSADGPSRLTLEGGTHNPAAPPFDFFARVFLPLLRRLGPDVRAVLERPGFYPAGGGCFRVEVAPVDVLEPFDLLERGEIRTRRARALLAQLPDHVGERELAQVRASLGWRQDETVLERVADSRGPGNALLLEVEAEHVTEICTAFGERGLRAEAVARKAAGDMGNYLRGRAPVGPWLADQLLVPLALAGGGAFRTSSPTLHTRTNIEVIETLLDVDVQLKQKASDDWHVVISRRKGGQA
jgi:RNA 3'-terminal phosphate cyclase (ATP)